MVINVYKDINDYKAYWDMAIGLQQVDNLEPSKYLLELVDKQIKDNISMNDLLDKLFLYYKNKSHDRTYECDMVACHIVEELRKHKNMFRLSMSHYATIHYELFKNIYKFAGEFREVNISKEEVILNNQSVIYGDYRNNNLYNTIEYDISREKTTNYEILSEEDKIKEIVKFTSNIWQIHPFMEGNTRTTAVFIIKYLERLGFNINYSLFKDNSKYFRNAFVRSNYYDRDNNIDCDYSYLIKFFENLLLNKNNILDNNELYLTD